MAGAEGGAPGVIHSAMHWPPAADGIPVAEVGNSWVYAVLLTQAVIPAVGGPLLGLTLTLLAYQAAYWIYRRAGFNPLLNPVLLAILMLVAALQRFR